jgi:serine/threonine protein kinase
VGGLKISKSAAGRLEGLELGNGWRVTQLLERAPEATGGHFSSSYLAERPSSDPTRSGVDRGFLKAFDFSRAFENGVDTIKVLQALTNAYEYERAILEHIRRRRLSHAVTAIDHGTVQVDGLGQMEGRVFYLIFQLADGDVRVQMDRATACDTLWCMMALRDVTLGLHQVHREFIAHQDTKPSNVLTYPGPRFRIADFGRSSMRGKAAPHDDFNVAGDRTYAPPELLYGQVDADFIKRRLACDLYMLGNLAGFLFSGINVSADLLARLAPEHHPNRWSGNYSEVLPYVQTAFRSVIADLEPLVDERVRAKIVSIVKELCQPDVSRRGHPRGVGRYSQFSLERYVSQMALFTKQLEVRMRIARQSA